MPWLRWRSTGSSSGAEYDESSALRDVLERLGVREESLEHAIDIHTQLARRCVRDGDRSGAMHALRRKRMHQQTLEQVRRQRLTLETQSMALQTAACNRETFGALRDSARVLQTLTGHANVDEVDDVMTTLQEQVADQRDAAEALGTSADVEDDEALLAEFEELLQGQEEQTVAVPFPEVPSHSLNTSGKTKANAEVNAAPRSILLS